MNARQRRRERLDDVDGRLDAAVKTLERVNLKAVLVMRQLCAELEEQDGGR